MSATDGLKIFNEDSEDDIRKLLVGRSIEEVAGDSLFLDDGTMLTVRPNQGCVCGNGCYYLDELNHVKNVITDVELCDEYRDDADLFLGYVPRVYRIYVIANGIRSLLMQVSGDDGNGYYGTGYEIYVEYPKEV